jgi:type IV secretory pathway TrbL component
MGWLDHYIIWIFHMVALPLIINDYKDIMITVLFYIETVMIMIHFWIWKRKKDRVQ